MGTGRTDEFRKDAVRIALTSGLSRRQVADDLGGGLSTLNKWVNAHRDTDVVSAEDLELARENERLRREIRILKEERDILKKIVMGRSPPVRGINSLCYLCHANSSVQEGGRGPCKSVIFLTGIATVAASPLSSAHQPMCHVF